MSPATPIPTPLTPSPAGLPLTWAGESLYLLPQRALWWPAEQTLFVADVHLGKAEHFRKLGVPVPAGPTASTLDRLEALIEVQGAQRVVILGDLLHARTAQAAPTLDVLRQWRAARSALDLVLVRGNHDTHAGDPPADVRIQSVDAPHALGPFALCHEPVEDGALSASSAFRLAGHIHPAVRLKGPGGDRVRLPCFAVSPDQMVLPAFGDFTGAATMAPHETLACYAIAGDSIFRVPAPARSRRRA